MMILGVPEGSRSENILSASCPTTPNIRPCYAPSHSEQARLPCTHAREQTQDDAIAVKDYIADDYADSEQRGNHTPLAVPSEHMLFERINASGLGLTIGSVGEGVVRNITFRDCYLRDTVKGLYLKFRRGRNHTPTGLGAIEHVTYERILLDRPQQWPIWIGPAQQADARNPCRANPCSLCWPTLPAHLTGAHCTGATTGVYAHLTLKDIDIFDPRHAPGVLMADPALPMRHVTFHNVRTHVRCGAASPLSADGFERAFSRLPTTVAPDWHVTLFSWLVAAGALATLALCATIAVRGSARARTLASAAFALAAALGARFAFLSIRLEDATAYYVCEGVNGGVATGDTWPVPPCFVDATVAHRRPMAARAVAACGGGLLPSEAVRWASASAALLLSAGLCCRRGVVRCAG